MKNQIVSISKKALAVGAVYGLCKFAFAAGKGYALGVCACTYDDLAEGIKYADYGKMPIGKKVNYWVVLNAAKLELKKAREA